MASVNMTDENTERLIRQYSDFLMPFSVLEGYYMMNNCFLEEGQLLRDAERIAHIPTFIVHGRFDAKRLERVKLEFTAAGHAQDEPANTEALVRGVG